MDKSIVLSSALLVKRSYPHEQNYLPEPLRKLNLVSDFIIRGNANESSLQVADTQNWSSQEILWGKLNNKDPLMINTDIMSRVLISLPLYQTFASNYITLLKLSRQYIWSGILWHTYTYLCYTEGFCHLRIFMF